MEGISGASTQQAFSLAIQKRALDMQADMVGKLMEGAAGLQQPPQQGAGLLTDALGERGLGTRLDVVA